MTFYSLMVVTCLLAPMCHYDTADSFGLLVRSADDCRSVAQQIAEARALGSGYEAEWKCSAPEVAGTWHRLGGADSSNGLWSNSQANSTAGEREAYWR